MKKVKVICKSAKKVTQKIINDDVFTANNYTEGKNQVLSSLFHSLLNENIGNNSNEVKQLIKGKESVTDAFFNTLSEKQLELYNNMYWEDVAVTTKVETERFILGFKFAVKLLTESLH